MEQIFPLGRIGAPCAFLSMDRSVVSCNQVHVCYDFWLENTFHFPVDKLNQYLLDTTNHDLTLTFPEMWMTKAYWQSTATTGTLGAWHNTFLIKDETRSQINSYVGKLVRGKEFMY